MPFHHKSIRGMDRGKVGLTGGLIIARKHRAKPQRRRALMCLNLPDGS